ncbi:MAG: 1-deoxy-D-xylulose-5-phosphate synthase [Dehalococcoidia bacterium]|jgi:1-deoxy-D-xylulose-5-phosphate synthase|nr:1-deoxy-D-xylulose-5-phosphate synthase [Dehalococcoidia bacterium]
MLERVNGHSDLKALAPDELRLLCAELRQVLVSTVTETGGHLSSNLGVVELTVALHRVFDSPRDRLLWDVGHQSYVHKLLTGRRDRFDTLRRRGGLSGFPDPEESEHDAFVAGHAGNCVSAALGLALARDRRHESHHVVAVTGDGCLTSGMTYEALNHAGHAGTRLIVVLNDNGMSISPTAGSLSRRLHMLRTGPAYSRLKRRTDRQLSIIPLGGRLRWLLRRLKMGAKAAVTPFMLLEELGLTYLGPVDGHDIPLLEEALHRACALRRPVVVHVMTQKGKGYAPAEADPVRYHGLAPASASVGTPSGETFSDVFAGTMKELLAADPRVVVITAAMLDGTGLADVASVFPDRVLDVGIAESHAVTLAGGLAAGGLRPVVAVYSTFLQRGFDQILHDVCLPGLPVVLALDRAGLVGEDGRTHHGAFDLAYLGLMPGMTVLAPRDGVRLSQMLRWALAAPGPVAVRYPRACAATVEGRLAPPDAAFTGRAQMLREGDDVLIVALGSMVAPALEAAEALRKDGIAAAVLDACLARPVDRDAIVREAGKVAAVVTVEEHVLSGGFGSAVMAALQEAGLHDVRLRRVGLPDRFVAHGPRTTLLSECGLDAEGIARSCLQAVGRRRV